jgi:hypothetical protein
LHLLYGDGVGGFSDGPVLDLDAQPNDVLSGDFDGDGTGDVLVAFNATAEIQLFLNTSAGVIPRPPLDLGDAFGGAHTTRVVGDFNSDGADDFAGITFQGGPGLIQVRLGATDEPLGQTQVITPSNNGSAQKLVLAEVNGDAMPDLVVRVSGGGQERLVFYPGSAGGSFGAEQLLVDGYSGEIAIADVNQDGRLDLLDRANIRLAEAGGGYAAPLNHYLETGTLPMRVLDMDGDGQPDLIGVSDVGDAVEILLHR